jgi:hypothetical protein
MNGRARNRLAISLVVGSLIGAASVPLIQLTVGPTRSPTKALAILGYLLVAGSPVRRC